MKIPKTLLAFAIAGISPAIATGYSTGFGTEYNYNVDVAGQEEWVIDDPTPHLSFFVDLNRNRAAALGGYYDAPLGLRTRLSHPVRVPLAGASFAVNMVMIESTETFPGRDSVAWCLVDPSGTELFTMGFEPAPGNPNLLNVTWSAGNQTPAVTGWALFYNAPYTIDLQFAEAVSGGVPFTATVTGSDSFTFSGILPGLAGATWDSISADFIVKGIVAGDNFMVFDDLTASPPPGFDGDGDGYSSEMEAWFGTSDASAASMPVPVMSRTDGLASLTFPSVPGRNYLIDSSGDLTTWVTAVVPATSSQTVWLEPAEPLLRQRYFRIRKP
jgi:hypothetical protein